MANIQFNDLNLSKSAAEYNFNFVLNTKEFWPIDGRNHDNLYVLQSTLDVLFNKHDDRPRIYVASSFRSQNSTRLIIQCKVCNKDLSSYDPFVGHDKGKSHCKAVQQCLGKDTSNPNISGTAIFRNWDDSNECFHFREGSLEAKLSQTAHHVLGHQFLYKSFGEEIYFCQLCYGKRHPPKSMNKLEAFHHVIKDKHLLKFMKVKYNRDYLSIDDAVADVDFQNIVKIEGKITANILEAHCIPEINRNQEKDTYKSPCQQETQTEQEPETVEMFMNKMLELKNNFNNNEGLVNLLKNDIDAYDLIIVLLKVIAQKFCTYSRNIDSTFMESAMKSLEKINALKIPPTLVDLEVD